MSFTSPLRRRQSRKKSAVEANVSEEIGPPKAVSTPFATPAVQKTSQTPYTTPFTRRRPSLCPPNVKDTQIKKAVSELTCLINKQWYPFNVSPLYNMNYGEVFLKRYARRLREKLMAHISDENSTEYEVLYTPLPRLRLNNVDHEALQVSVDKIFETGKRSIAYNAIFLSWGATRNMQMENAVFLPILICSGLKGVIKQVHAEFQLIHDCFISSFGIHDEDLRMLSIGIFENSSYEEGDLIKLSYNLPEKFKSGILDITLPASTLCVLWKSIHKATSNQVNDVEMASFWSELHAHTYCCFGIDLGQCAVSKVSLPDVAFNHDAIYAKKKEKMYLLLCFLMSMNNILSSVAPQVHEVVLPSD